MISPKPHYLRLVRRSVLALTIALIVWSSAVSLAQSTDETAARALVESFFVAYQKEDLTELSLAYAVTIHKSQGSEFEAVINPITAQHFKMLFRNLIYTGLTRAKKLAVFVGSRTALAMAVRTMDSRKRQTALTTLLN